MLDLTSLERASGQMEKALSYKLMRRSLIERAASADEVESLSFPDTIREAARAGLLDDPERWFVFRTIRNKTSHAYDEAYASEAYSTAVDFLPYAKDLLARLRGA